MVLLFGSYAYGTPHKDSDIDLLVVTNDDFMPKNFEERTKIYLSVSKLLRTTKREISIDLIVHTLPMYKKFIKQNSLFAHEITTKGKIIYERDNKGVA